MHLKLVTAGAIALATLTAHASPMIYVLTQVVGVNHGPGGYTTVASAAGSITTDGTLGRCP